MQNSPDSGIENDPPHAPGLFSGYRVTMPESDYYDQWGNLKGTPDKTIEEYHGDNFIKIFIYKYQSISAAADGRDNDYFFGFQLKLDKVVRQKRASIADPPLRCIDEARLAAQNMIIDLCRKNKAIKRVFADFTIIRYNQPELF
jgi:hypothetical protein